MYELLVEFKDGNKSKIVDVNYYEWKEDIDKLFFVVNNVAHCVPISEITRFEAQDKI